MLDKFRHPLTSRTWNVKSVVVLFLFGAIIVSTALFGIINPDRFGGTSVGSAAVVNDTPILMRDLGQMVERAEARSRMPLDKLPPEQRELYSKQIRLRILDQLIQNEVIYQTAGKEGVSAPNGEVRDELTGVTAFQDNGRFARKLYDMYLEQNGLNSEDFEREIRKSIVIRRMADLFQTAGMPSAVELNQVVELNSKQASIRFLDISPSKINAEKTVTDQEVSEYLKNSAHDDAIKKHYEAHALEYSLPEKVRARHILLMVDEKHPEKDILEKIKKIREGLTPQNFSTMAMKESQDPGSAKKGGELGAFERGRMVPQFDKAAFEMKPGVISEPIKTDYGYHLILVDEHQEAHKVGMDEAKPGIARKLIAQEKAPQVLETVKKAVASGRTSEVDAVAHKMGLAWEKADDVNLGIGQIPRVRDTHDILLALAKRNGKTGLIPNVIGSAEGQYVVDVSSWKPNAKPSDREELSRSLAEMESEEAFQGWIRDSEAKTSITRNPRLYDGMSRQ